MSNNDNQDSGTSPPAKYPNLMAAIKANDAPACYDIAELLKQDGRPLTPEQIDRVGCEWLKTCAEPAIMLPFFHDMKFNFKDMVIFGNSSVVGIPNAMLLSERGSLALIEALNIGAIDVDYRTSGGTTLLESALSEGRFEVADRLMELGASVNAKDLAGQTPLFNRVAALDILAIDYLLQRGADPGIENNFMVTAAEMLPESDSSPEILSPVDILFNQLSDISDALASGQSPVFNSDYSEIIAAAVQADQDQKAKANAARAEKSPKP